MNKELLIIGIVWPEPKSSAAGTRMMHLIYLFLSKNYNITFATACAKSDNAFNLKSIGVVTKEIELNNSSFDVFVKKLNPDIVIFDRFMTEEQFGWRVAEQCPNALRLLDTEDLHCLRKGRQQALKDQSVFNTHYLFNAVAKREIASIYRCDLTLIISEVEVDILKHQFKVDEHLLCYLPFLLESISPKQQSVLPGFRAREHFVTVGNFLHEPNLDGIKYLKEYIWPTIRKQLPKAEMHIYGSYESHKVTQLEDKKSGFYIKGFVEDIATVMQQYKVCLVPLRFGAGLKGKIIDAMYNGTPCITTSIGAEGMYGTLEPNGFIEDEPLDFAKMAVELYSNKIFWNAKQKHGVNVINLRFDKQLFTADFMHRVEATKNGLEVHRKSNFTGAMLMHHTLQSTKFMSKWIEEKNA
ncbi:glycosyltransferase [Lacinutrix sp. 5H-3-7-4]|uniref:glycosyltransferase n=1 Tax=Lacinutrix sp. (strain 5H-3-7-4) TaxID=983544 RepID=UPI00020A3E50|nr:glycosyltransferase [Lacinutrix sp. 5H-3-7-4]AEH01871.1 glycosyl transferase group 1 [Lacinutrix sp. 5H-3-7-4]